MPANSWKHFRYIYKIVNFIMIGVIEHPTLIHGMSNNT